MVFTLFESLVLVSIVLPPGGVDRVYLRGLGIMGWARSLARI